jgi:hypothetical protein
MWRSELECILSAMSGQPGIEDPFIVTTQKLVVTI